MRLVSLSDEIMAVIDRFVASGATPDHTSFIEAAVCRHVAELHDGQDDESQVLIAQAEHGIEDIAAGRYQTVSNSAEADAFWNDIASATERKAAELRMAAKTAANA